MKIHMSEDAKNAIIAFPEFIAEYRGDICVKVKTDLSYPLFYRTTLCVRAVLAIGLCLSLSLSVRLKNYQNS